MKKFYLLLLGLLLVGSLAQAQQIPVFSQYFYNDYLWNPAKAGNSILPNFLLAHRVQWSGIPGAPVTTVFSADALIPKHYSGVGFNVVRDEVHFMRNTRVMGSYAYHAILAPGNVLSLGASMGFNNLTFNMNEAIKALDNPNDLRVLGANPNAWAFDATLGLDYRWNHLHIGMAIPQVLGNRYTFNNTLIGRDSTTLRFSQVRHFIGSVKYSLHLNNRNKLEPIAFIRNAPGIRPQLDFGLLYTYHSIFWMGAAYRQEYATSLTTGFIIKDHVKVSYAYDLPMGDIRRYAGNTHEIMVGIRFGDTNSPEYLRFMNEIDPDMSWIEVITEHPRKQIRNSRRQSNKMRKRGHYKRKTRHH